MPPKKKTAPVTPIPAEDIIAGKLDTLTQALNAFIVSQKTDATEEIDPITAKYDAQLEAGTKAFRLALEGSFTKEKLDAWGYDELVIAMSMKQDAITPTINEIPAKKEDTEKNPTPPWLRATVE